MKVHLRIFVITLLMAGSAIWLSSCKKDPVPPSVTTAGVSVITLTTATSGGNVTADGGAEVTSRGVCWNTSENPTVSNSKTSDGTGTGSFTSSLTGLTPGTPYFVRAYATNEAGTTYGNQQSFTTSPVLLATVTTADISTYNDITAVSGGNITNDGGGNITARGVCWSSTSQTPTVADSKTEDGSSTGSFTSNLTGLEPGTTYYVRAYAVNSAGHAYGDPVSFTTLLAGTMIDTDGNVYNTVTIGFQVWMAENLKSTKFKDGISIPLVTDNTAWSNLTTPGYCWYANNSANKDTYGALYNWYTVNTGKLCPAGWHVPTDAEWTTLENYLIASGYNYDGTTTGNKIAKALASTTLWEASTVSGAVGNTDYPDKRNATGFAAFPGGFRYDFGIFPAGLNSFAYWWSATAFDVASAWIRNIWSNFGDLDRHENEKKYGHSVRCVRD